MLHANIFCFFADLVTYVAFVCEKKITFAQRESLVWRFETTKSEFLALST